MLLAVCPLVAALQTGFGRPGLMQPPAFSAGPARSARSAAASSARLPAVSMQATDTAPVLDDLTKYYDGEAPLEDRMWDYVKQRGGDRLIRRILIANNGMAATKTIMSIRQWAYETFGDPNPNPNPNPDPDPDPDRGPGPGPDTNPNPNPNPNPNRNPDPNPNPNPHPNPNQVTRRRWSSS